MAATEVRELTVEQRVKKVMAFAPALMSMDAPVISLTVMLAHGGTRASRYVEQLADDLAGLNEQRTILREQMNALRDELEQKLRDLGAEMTGTEL